MTPEEVHFYREAYRTIGDPVIQEQLVKYAKMQYNKADKKLKCKNDQYDYGYWVGQLDAWQEIITLKVKLAEVLKNIG